MTHTLANVVTWVSKYAFRCVVDDAHLGQSRAPCVVCGVNYIDLMSLAPPFTFRCLADDGRTNTFVSVPSLSTFVNHGCDKKSINVGERAYPAACHTGPVNLKFVHTAPLFFKIARNLDWRCVLVPAISVLGPKHVSNPDYRSLHHIVFAGRTGSAPPTCGPCLRTATTPSSAQAPYQYPLSNDLSHFLTTFPFIRGSLASHACFSVQIPIRPRL